MGIDRVATVTGAGSGIGRATAELFAARGWGVVAADLSEPSLAWVAGDERFHAVAGDVADPSTGRRMVRAARDRWGRLDVAVLSAGISASRPWEADDAMAVFDKVLAVNLKGVALGIRHAAPAIRDDGGGAIVAVASTSGLRADPTMWAYNASKAGVVNLVRAAAIDWATQGVRVNAVAPGPIETGMTAGLAALPEIHGAMARHIPMQRWGRPREVAEVIWFLASPAASFVTGVTVPCDGGISAHAGHLDLPPSPSP